MGPKVVAKNKSAAFSECSPWYSRRVVLRDGSFHSLFISEALSFSLEAIIIEEGFLLLTQRKQTGTIWKQRVDPECCWI